MRSRPVTGCPASEDEEDGDELWPSQAADAAAQSSTMQASRERMITVAGFNFDRTRPRHFPEVRVRERGATMRMIS